MRGDTEPSLFAAWLIALAVIAPGCSRIAGIGGEFEARGTGDAGPVDSSELGDTIGTVDVLDALASCFCSGATLTCPGNVVTQCAATCLEQPDPHCSQLQPSNQVDRTLLAQVSTKITVISATVIDTGTGAITGGITRASGTGLKSGIVYSQFGTLGIFVFDELEISAAVTLRVTGTRLAVFLSNKTVRVTGTIDASGDQTTLTYDPGPGGGAGEHGTSAAGGCSPGGSGNADGGSYSDSGGGGGGGGAAGGGGGNAGAVQGGTNGTACIPATLEPLKGGSGGGLGSLGIQPNDVSAGGGGGGGLQISSLEQIVITGIIDVGGAGGLGGPKSSISESGGGGGGGAGGGLLLEAPVVSIPAGAIVVANGGAGGGAADSTISGGAGADGQRSTAVATGGAPQGGGTKGGNGGAYTTAAQSAANAAADNNSGGGGGGVGVIFVRSYATPVLAGTISPLAGTGSFRGD